MTDNLRGHFIFFQEKKKKKKNRLNKVEKKLKSTEKLFFFKRVKFNVCFFPKASFFDFEHRLWSLTLVRLCQYFFAGQLK
jgi:hypothetical protein